MFTGGKAGAYEWGLRFYSKDPPRPNRVSAYIWNLTSTSGDQNGAPGPIFRTP
jgi:hypothetical protein